MKKLFLAVAVLGVVSLSSCKSEKEKVDERVENTQEQMVETTAEQVKAGEETLDKVEDVAEKFPTFSSPEANEWAKKYGELAKEMKVAAAAGNQTKLNELSKRAVDLTAELKNITQNLTPEDAKKIQDWATEIQKGLNK